MSAGQNLEAGIQPYRLEFVRETTKGSVPDDPSWLRFSDNAVTFEPSLDPNAEGQFGLGSASPRNHFTGVHSYEMTVEYHLQRAIQNGTNDASDDAIQRSANNRLSNSHSLQRRMDQAALSADATVNGSTSLDTRRYLVGKGGLADVTFTGDPSDAQPVLVTLDYMFEKAEEYQIDQPASSTALDVISTNANDSGTVTIEDEGAATTETITISAGGTANGTESFDNIDAVELDSEQPGDITINDGTNDLMVIPGQESFDHGEGALGVPALGSGSHESALNSAYEQFVGDSIERPSGTALADNVTAFEISVDNNITADDTATGPRPFTYSEEQIPQATGTAFGEVAFHNFIRDVLESTATNTEWVMDNDTIRIDNAQLLESTHTEEATQGRAEIDFTLQGEGITIDP